MYKIYSKDNCPACFEAKKLLPDAEVLLLGKDYTILDLYRIAPKSHKSFPMITFNGEYLGGLRGLEEHIQSHKE